jgi:type I restriction enzyme S subunit
MHEGWKHKSVEEICERVSVGIVIKPSQYYVEERQGIRAFRSANVAENRIVDDNWVYLSPKGHAANAKSCLRIGDVLVVRSGAPGTACVVTPEFEGANCIDVVFARPNPNLVLPEYLSEYTNSAVGKQHVLGNKGGLALQHFNVGAYKEMIVLLPPLPEQRKIAEILRTWDEAIEKLEALRAAKLRRHRALTHSLVFGTRQLDRFRTTDEVAAHRWFTLPATWGTKPIGKLAREISERNGDGEQHEVLSCSKYDGFVRSLEYFKKQVFSADLSGYKKIWRGDFGFPSNHVEEGSIGLQNLTDVGVVSPIYTVFRFALEKVDADYAFAVLKTGLYRHIFEVSTSASVDRRGSLRWSEFSKLPFPLPSLAEQRAIAEVLRTAQTDLDALNTEIEALTRQKRGLMQKLLTGEWRVKVEAD